jgi:hypothetical protein
MPAIPDPYTFLSLKNQLRTRIDRGGDSEMGDALAGQFINQAEQFILAELGPAWFINSSSSFVIPANTYEYSMPATVDDVISLRDEGNLVPLIYIEKAKWNAYITDPDYQTGQPTAWTKFDFVRSTDSPAAAYDQIKIQVTPTPSTAFTLYYDAVLRAGYMVDDTDLPIIPTNFHGCLLAAACMLAGQVDVTSEFYQVSRDLFRTLFRGLRRRARQELSGNPTFVPRETHERRLNKNSLVPPTRRQQLFGW